jgi:peptide deformylase
MVLVQERRTALDDLVDEMATAGVARPVRHAPDPVLGMVGGPVDPCAPATVRLAADLSATLRLLPAGWVGLAAPQIGRPAQVLVIDVRTHPRATVNHGALALCNARVVQASGWDDVREGCRSVPGLTGEVRRAHRIVVAGQLPGSGDEVEVRTEGLEARTLQHGIDHCAGLLFLHRITAARAIYRRG